MLDAQARLENWLGGSDAEAVCNRAFVESVFSDSPTLAIPLAKNPSEMVC
jgi:hypothetical protein